MLSVVDRNVVMWRIPVKFRKTVAVSTEGKEKHQNVICEQNEEMFSADIGETYVCACVGP
jgi:hypothetical protein